MDKLAQFRKFTLNSLEVRESYDPKYRIVDAFLTVIILLNIFAVTFETVDSFAREYKPWLDLFKYFSIFEFTIELGLRLWVAPDHPEVKYQHPVWGRLRFLTNPFFFFDLLAVVPSWLNPLGVADLDCRFFRLFRIIKILGFSHFSHSIQALETVLEKEAHNLLVSFVVMLMMLFVSSALIYFVERGVQPDKFGSIPMAMWWAVAALTTVGFGDVVPITTVGKLLGGSIMLLGLIIFALPAAILSSAFVEEIKTIKFLTTWKLVAKVPFFEGLNAIQISEIAETLKPKTISPGEFLFHKGQKANAMYFVVTGQVEIQVQGKIFIISSAEFFGEMALLYGTRRNASAKATAYSELLCLESGDFHTLLNKYPDIKQVIEKEAEKRKQEQLAR